MSTLVRDVLTKQKKGVPAGIVSICTANRYAITASMKAAEKHGSPLLIEATANQVDQNGGYTGMTPAEFCTYVHGLARESAFPVDRLILGGDHLGPLTRKGEDEETAMDYAEELVRAYVLAGFTKIHLDTSMRLGSDSPDRPLEDETIALRSARLCRAAEDAFSQRLAQFPGSEAPVYVIGSEVPIPGGTQSAEETASVTSPGECRKTFDTFQKVYTGAGLSSAFERVIALVVQTGAEFGDNEVFLYTGSDELTAYGKESLPIVFEGHSTDYQPAENLKAMVRDGIAVLKVGPALTFALREALFALQRVEEECVPESGRSNFAEVLEQVMVESPVYWDSHYHGSDEEIRLARRYSYSDRARYYLNHRDVEEALRKLLVNLEGKNIPPGLMSQYLPLEFKEGSGSMPGFSARDIVYRHIGNYLEGYYRAVTP